MADPTFIPPANVAEQAARGLAMREKFGRGGTRIGARRGSQLADREKVSLDTIRRMASYFARHEVDSQADGWADEKDPSAGWIAWLLWGGDAGRAWASRVLADVEKDTAESGSICVVAMLPPALASQFPKPSAPDTEQQMPPHVTVLYAEMDRGRLALAERIIRDVAGLAQPFEIRVGGLGHFDHADQSVAWAGVDSPGLVELRAHMLQAIQGSGIGADQTHPDYTPHATIAYLAAGERWTGPVPAGAFTARVLSVWVMGRPSSFCGVGQDDTEIEGWPEDMAKASDRIAPPPVAKWHVQPHVRPDIHFAGHTPGGHAVKEVEKSLRDLEEKAKGLSPEDQEKLAKALDESAKNVRKAATKDPAADDEEMKKAKAKEEELAKAKAKEEEQLKAKQVEEAEKTRKAKEDEEKAKVEEEKKRVEQQKAGGWPMDMAR